MMFIYREEIYDPRPENAGQAEIIVAKHRSGPTGVVQLAFLPQYTRFANMAPRVRLRSGCCSSSGSGSRSLGARSRSRFVGGSGARRWRGVATGPVAASSRSTPSRSSTSRDITDRDARAGLYPSAAALVADLRGTPDLDLYRIRFHIVDEPDPRSLLAESGELSDADVAELDRRLDRLDGASRHGAWTEQTLELIARRPGVRAGDLADEVGRERLPFKADVRKLKNLGLTISLDVGYRLSPRGEAYLTTRR